ncbi:MAG: hypothetical protein HYY50_03695 [Candidatus Kerfeldbacteria bacterium]|nr:hypothetical protein [Candidatus Kerfeldbacteria bacterium]
MSKRPFIAGLVAADALLVVFVLLVTSISGWATTKNQFGQYWYYFVPLAVGFGVQVGLYIHLREVHQRMMSKRLMAVTGSTSTATMVSCCAHYLANILPIISAAGVSTFIGQYQVQLFWVGLAFNLFGIGYLARQVIRVRTPVVGTKKIPREIASAAPSLINNAVVITAFVIVVTIVSILGGRTNHPTPQAAEAGNATGVSSSGLTRTNAENGMTVSVTPQRNTDGSWEFSVSIDNHAVNVTQDMVTISSLIDAAGQAASPQGWVGDPPGGHHRKGILKFGVLASPPVSLTLRDLGGVPVRTFMWDNLTSW